MYEIYVQIGLNNTLQNLKIIHIFFENYKWTNIFIGALLLPLTGVTIFRAKLITKQINQITENQPYKCVNFIEKCVSNSNK